MANKSLRWLTRMTLAAAALFGQTATSVVGTVVAIRPESSEVEVKPDTGAAITVKFSLDTLVQRVAPGEKTLKNAAPATIADVAAGDRVLVTMTPDSPAARRIVVMPTSDIAKRNEADRQEWNRRGVAGVVTAKAGNRITLRLRSFTGESQATVIWSEATTFRRYAPDSVKFAGAKPSKATEIRNGDQLRARGEKSPDGTTVTASEVVFGTFVTEAGIITEVRADQNEITIRDLENGRLLVVKLTADSQIKRMPGFPGFTGSGGPGGRPGGGPSAEGGFGRMGPGAGPPAGGSPDFSQMLERMPSLGIGALKPGETVVFSSTRGASNQQLTAIMLLSNAEMLVQMASRMSRSSPSDGLNTGSSMGLGSTFGSAGSLELPGMIP